jgi:hypothetical protein
MVCVRAWAHQVYEEWQIPPTVYAAPLDSDAGLRHALDVAKRLATQHHAHHDLIVAAMPVTLDHEFRLETLALRGNALALRQFADLLRAQRRGRHGKLNPISVGATSCA